jgi:hypothetical protein
VSEFFCIGIRAQKVAQSILPRVADIYGAEISPVPRSLKRVAQVLATARTIALRVTF